MGQERSSILRLAALPTQVQMPGVGVERAQEGIHGYRPWMSFCMAEQTCSAKAFIVAYTLSLSFPMLNGRKELVLKPSRVTIVKKKKHLLR